MPEGDTIFRAAKKLRAALAGKRITRFATNMPELRGAKLAGKQVKDAFSHGKNLYIAFDDGRVLHSHMQMHGVWRVYKKTDETWEKRVQYARILFETDTAVAACFRAPIIELVTARAAERGRKSLGPDLLAESFDEDRALSLLRTRAAYPLGVAVMSQRAVAGIGNIFKSETLFVARENPFATVSTLTDDRLRAILRHARTLLTKSAHAKTGVRVFRSAEIRSETHWVYRRDGMPCFACGATIKMKRQGDDGRSTYFCPKCQNTVIPR